MFRTGKKDFRFLQMTNVCRYKVTAEEKIHLKTRWNIPWQYTKEPRTRPRAPCCHGALRNSCLLMLAWRKKNAHSDLNKTVLHLPRPRLHRQMCYVSFTAQGQSAHWGSYNNTAHSRKTNSEGFHCTESIIPQMNFSLTWTLNKPAKQTFLFSPIPYVWK